MEALDIANIVHHPLMADISALARTVADVPMAAVCMIDLAGTWHSAPSGLEVAIAPLSFAAEAVSRADIVQVINRSASKAYTELDALNVEAAAALPIAAPDGDVIGCLCILDTESRVFSAELLENVTTLTRQVERHVDRAIEQHHLRDLSVRLVDSEAALAETLSRLERSNRDLEHFAYHAAHELQAPLQAVAAFASLIEDAIASGGDDSLLETSARHVQAETERLRGQVASLFALAKFSKAGPKTEPIPIAALIADVVDSGAETLTTVEITCGPELSARGDGVALRTVMSNLLSNAYRYRSPDRKPVVQFSASKVDEKVTIDISDNGIGIAFDEQQRIFEAFQQVNRSGPGAGLGLAMCRRIVEQLDGSIRVRSELGEGSTFTVILPAD